MPPRDEGSRAFNAPNTAPTRVAHLLLKSGTSPATYATAATVMPVTAGSSSACFSTQSRSASHASCCGVGAGGSRAASASDTAAAAGSSPCAPPSRPSAGALACAELEAGLASERCALLCDPSVRACSAPPPPPSLGDAAALTSSLAAGLLCFAPAAAAAAASRRTSGGRRTAARIRCRCACRPARTTMTRSPGTGNMRGTCCVAV